MTLVSELPTFSCPMLTYSWSHLRLSGSPSRFLHASATNNMPHLPPGHSKRHTQPCMPSTSEPPAVAVKGTRLRSKFSPEKHHFPYPAPRGNHHLMGVCPSRQIFVLTPNVCQNSQVFHHSIFYPPARNSPVSSPVITHSHTRSI